MTASGRPARPVEAVTFDFWNTLVRPDDEATRRVRAAAVQAVLVDVGVEVDDQALSDAFTRTFALHTEHWRSNRQFTYDHGVAHIVSTLELDLDEPTQERFALAYAEAAADLDMALADHVPEALLGLHDRGVKIGIVCDVGMTPSRVLRGWLERHGVLALFDHWSFSDEVGWYKPAPQIFDHALAGLGGIDPAAAAHVGDLRRTDVAGAQAAGLVAVRYRGEYDDGGAAPDDGHAYPEADHVIDDHLQLLDVLPL